MAPSRRPARAVRGDRMPGPTRSGGHHAGPRRSGFGALVASLPIAPIEVRAESLLRPSNGWLESAALIERPELAALALTLGVIVFAVIASVALVRTRLRAAAESAGFRWEGAEAFGQHYAETLRQWRVRYDAARQDGRLPPGFDAAFDTIWRYYLMYCEGGFRSGGIDVVQALLRRP